MFAEGQAISAGNFRPDELIVRVRDAAGAESLSGEAVLGAAGAVN